MSGKVEITRTSGILVVRVVERMMPLMDHGRRVVDSKILVKRRKAGVHGRRKAHESAVEKMYLSVHVSFSAQSNNGRAYSPGGVVRLGSHL